MRDPFPYETNDRLLRQFLVPDPLDEATWRRVVERGRQGARGSLLEWIVETGLLTRAELHGILLEAAGVDRLHPWEPDPGSDHSAEAGILRGNGFCILPPGRTRRRVAGGAELPPDMSRYLGGRSGNWEWVLVSPLREPVRREAAGPKFSTRQAEGGTNLEQWVLELFSEATLKGASDIHFERTGSLLEVRLRGSGRMESLGQWRDHRGGATMRLLKHWANFDTSENPLPMDGRLRVPGGASRYSFRASHITTVNGESMVLRVVGSESRLKTLARLGVPDKLVSRLRDCALYDRGLALCTGVTGSGKTTTLCSLVAGLDDYPLKILTIEDPVEYELPNATQSCVNEAQGWTFATALRAFLRQDPDVILVGEIRDRESAEIACRAGLTGHCVLSTLHARRPLTAVERLHAWGIETGVIAESLRLVVHQRLLRTPSGELSARFEWMSPEPVEIRGFLKGEREDLPLSAQED